MTNQTKNKSFAIPSAKPVDVEYRLKRASEVVDQLKMFLSAIDSTVLPEGHLAGLLADVSHIQEGIDYAFDNRPSKKTSKKEKLHSE